MKFLEQWESYLENQNRMSEIYNKIKWFEIEIGSEIIIFVK